jgi:hypothetical protein
VRNKYNVPDVAQPGNSGLYVVFAFLHDHLGINFEAIICIFPKSLLHCFIHMINFICGSLHLGTTIKYFVDACST